MTTYVLIMLFGGWTSQSGMTTLTQEFHNFETCEIARKHIEMSVKETSPQQWNYMPLRSTGCFKK
jgi:hypothetical protein